jgi:fermentation-respiration switch protein FrsA (DUF1100 family)
MMLKIPAIVLGSLLGLYIIISAVLAFLLVFLLLHPKGDRRRTYEQVRTLAVEKGLDLSWYDAAIREPFTLDIDGFALSGEYIPAPSSPGVLPEAGGGGEAGGKLRPKCVILAHGYSQNRMTSGIYAAQFREAGYDVVIYDHRGFGSSGGELCTLGDKERYDLLKVIGWTRQKIGPDAFIGLHGESMGGTVVLEAAALASRDTAGQKLGFVIADCAPSDIGEYLGITLGNMFHLPSQPGRFFAALFARAMGVDVGSISPRSHLNNVDTPVLIIHGEGDTNVPVAMARELRGTKANRILELFPGADHAESYLTDQARYRRVVTEFIRNAEKIPSPGNPAQGNP